MSTTEILTAIVAVYGALLATFTLVVQQREKRRKIKVKLRLGFLGGAQGDTTDIIIMEAANSGLVPVHLSSCCFHLPETKKQLIARFSYDKEMPITLAPGESVQAWMLSEKFVEAVRKEGNQTEVKVAAKFSNKAGGEYSSKPEVLNLEKMLYTKNKGARGA